MTTHVEQGYQHATHLAQLTHITSRMWSLMYTQYVKTGLPITVYTQPDYALVAVPVRFVLQCSACTQKVKDPEARQQLQTQLARIEQQIKEEQTRRQHQTSLKSHKVCSLHEVSHPSHSVTARQSDFTALAYIAYSKCAA